MASAMACSPAGANAMELTALALGTVSAASIAPLAAPTTTVRLPALAASRAAPEPTPEEEP